MVGWYGGSEEYALISSLRFSRETFRKQRLQAPISVTPEHHRKADRQMLVDAISPSHSPTLSRIPVDGQTGSYRTHFCPALLCKVCERKTTVFRPAKRRLLSVLDRGLFTISFIWSFPLSVLEPSANRSVADPVFAICRRL